MESEPGRRGANSSVKRYRFIRTGSSSPASGTPGCARLRTYRCDGGKRLRLRDELNVALSLEDEAWELKVRARIDGAAPAAFGRDRCELSIRAGSGGEDPGEERHAAAATDDPGDQRAPLGNVVAI